MRKGTRYELREGVCGERGMKSKKGYYKAWFQRKPRIQNSKFTGMASSTIQADRLCCKNGSCLRI